MALRLDENSGTLVPCRTELPPNASVALNRVGPDEIVVVMPGQSGGYWLVFGGLGFIVTAAVTVAGPNRDVLPLWLDLVLGVSSAGMFVKGLFNRFGKTLVRITPERFTISKRLWGLGWRHSGRTSEINAVRTRDRSEGKKDADGNDMPPEEMIEIRTPWRYYGFGLSLQPAERLWVVRELGIFLREIGHPVD
jgi:hypothetical protein